MAGIKNFSIFVLCLFLVGGCGKNKGSAGDTSDLPSYPTPERPAFSFDYGVNSEHENLLQGDLDLLTHLNFPSATKTECERIGLSNMMAPALSKYISERIKYIVGENYDAEQQRYGVAIPAGYSPTIFASQAREYDETQVVTIMRNSGSGTYRSGKSSNTLYYLPLNGAYVKVESPRVGVIQIGPGLFTANSIKSSPLDARVNRLLRLGTLFHESRHSDGNGDNAAFPHKKCETGDFAGKYACESNANGPYAIESLLLKRFYEACSNCSQKEKAGLQLMAADAASRLVNNPISPDPRPERIQ